MSLIQQRIQQAQQRIRPVGTGATPYAPTPGQTTNDAVPTAGPIPNLPAPSGPNNSAITPTPAPQSPPTPLMQPGTPGATITPFGPQAGDLRGGMIAPGASTRSTAAGQRTDTAANNVASFNRPQAIGSYAQGFNQSLRYNPTQFQGVNTQVSRGPIDPNLKFQGVDTNLNAGGRVDPNDTADMQQFRSMRSGAANSLTSGTTRSEIARQQMEAFDLENQPLIRDQLRAVGQRAASLGRLGMGDTAVEALNPFTDYLTRRAAMAKQLGAETAEGEIGDRFNTLGAARGLVGEEESIASGRRGELRGERDYSTEVEDINIGRQINERDTALGLSERNTARQMDLMRDDMGLAERNVDRLRGERDASQDLSERNAMRDYDARRAALEMATGVAGQDQASNLASAGLLGGLEDSIYGRESDQREELRGERDYQSTVERMALEDAIRQQQMEMGQEDRDWSKDLAEDSLEAGINPAGIYMGASGQYGNAGAGGYSAAGDLLAQWLARQKAQRGS